MYKSIHNNIKNAHVTLLWRNPKLCIFQVIYSLYLDKVNKLKLINERLRRLLNKYKRITTWRPNSYSLSNNHDLRNYLCYSHKSKITYNFVFDRRASGILYYLSCGSPWWALSIHPAGRARSRPLAVWTVCPLTAYLRVHATRDYVRCA